MYGRIWLRPERNGEAGAAIAISLARPRAAVRCRGGSGDPAAGGTPLVPGGGGRGGTGQEEEEEEDRAVDARPMRCGGSLPRTSWSEELAPRPCGFFLIMIIFIFIFFPLSGNGGIG